MRRVLAILLAILLVGGVMLSVLPLFGLAEEAQGNQYALAMTVDLETQTILVDETIDYVNRTGRALDSVWLNVYANTLRRAETVPLDNSELNDAFPVGYAPGGVDFINVTLNGKSADWAMAGSGEQFMRIECALESGETARIALRFRLFLTRSNGALGIGDLGWRLFHFYPIAAVYDPFAGDFALNGWTAAVDPMTSDVSDYEAVVALPQGWMLASTGEAQAG